MRDWHQKATIFMYPAAELENPLLSITTISKVELKKELGRLNCPSIPWFWGLRVHPEALGTEFRRPAISKRKSVERC